MMCNERGNDEQYGAEMKINAMWSWLWACVRGFL